MDDPSQTITGEWPCIACEQLLTGLSRDGVCPECGTPVALSLRDDRLAHANPLWMLRISQAATLICFASVVAMSCELAMVQPIAISSTSALGHIFIRLQTLTSVLTWLGVWLLGTPEYVVAGRFRSEKWCWALRIVATLSLLCDWCLLPVLDLSPMAKLLAALAAPVGILLTYLYLRELAKRLAERMLVIQAPIVAACLIVANLIDHALPRLEPLWFVRAPHWMTLNLQRLVFVLSTGYSVYVLARFSTRFTTAANGAMESYLSEKATINASTK